MLLPSRRVEVHLHLAEACSALVVVSVIVILIFLILLHSFFLAVYHVRVDTGEFRRLFVVSCVFVVVAVNVAATLLVFRCHLGTRGNETVGSGLGKVRGGDKRVDVPGARHELVLVRHRELVHKLSVAVGHPYVSLQKARRSGNLSLEGHVLVGREAHGAIGGTSDGGPIVALVRLHVARKLVAAARAGKRPGVSRVLRK